MTKDVSGRWSTEGLLSGLSKGKTLSSYRYRVKIHQLKVVLISAAVIND